MLTTVAVLERQWCREMKVIQAFSWMDFVLYVFALITLIVLVSRAQAFGRYNIWREPIRGAASALFLFRFNLTWYLELPWFGEAPGYYNTTATGVNPVYPVMGQYPGGVHPQIQPGSALVVQPGVNGQLPTITQIPIASNVWTNKAVTNLCVLSRSIPHLDRQRARPRVCTCCVLNKPVSSCFHLSPILNPYIIPYASLSW